MKTALLDASAMVALFRASDVGHAHYRALLDSQAPQYQQYQLHSTWPCVTEASHLLKGRDRLLLLRWIGHGAVQLFPLDAAELLELVPLMERYSEPPRSVMDLADASLYWLAQETGTTVVMTLDVRDFSRYRLPDGRSFEIL